MRPPSWTTSVLSVALATMVEAAADVEYLTDLEIYSLMAPCAGEAVYYNIARQTTNSACPEDAAGLQDCVCSTSTSAFLSRISATIRGDCGSRATDDQTSATLLWKKYCTQDEDIEFSTPTTNFVDVYITELPEMEYLPRCAQSAVSEAVMGNGEFCPAEARLYAPCICSKASVTSRVSKTIEASVSYSCADKEDVTAAQDFYHDFCAMTKGTTSFKKPSGPPGDMTYYITALPQFKSLHDCAQKAFTGAVQNQQNWLCPSGPQALASCACLKSGVRRSISSTLTSQVKGYCDSTATADVTSAFDVFDVYCKAAADETQFSVQDSVSETGLSSRTGSGGAFPSETGKSDKNKSSGNGSNDSADDASDQGGDGDGSTNTAAIVGGVVGGVLGLLLLAAGIFLGCRLQRRKQAGGGNAPQMVQNPPGTPELQGAGTFDGTTKGGAYSELTAGPWSSQPTEVDPQQQMPRELAGQVAYRSELSPDRSPQRSPAEQATSASTVSRLSPQDQGGMGWQSGPVSAYELGQSPDR